MCCGLDVLACRIFRKWQHPRWFSYLRWCPEIYRQHCGSSPYTFLYNELRPNQNQECSLLLHQPSYSAHRFVAHDRKRFSVENVHRAASLLLYCLHLGYATRFWNDTRSDNRRRRNFCLTTIYKVQPHEENKENDNSNAGRISLTQRASIQTTTPIPFAFSLVDFHDNPLLQRIQGSK